MVGIIFLVLCFCILIVVAIYNNLVRLSNLVKNAFSSIDVMLKRRYDLIPNLVETVKTYMNYEESVLKRITELRVEATQSNISIDEKVKIDNDISSNMSKIFALSEGYPDLKANENFLKLQTATIDVENEISAARRSFNSSATEYNINISVFPNNIFASFFEFKEISLFKTDDIENVIIKLR